MSRENDQLSAVNRTLLTQSLPFLALAKDAYQTNATQAPPGWETIAATDEPQRQHIAGFFARVYKRTDSEGWPQYAVAFRGTDSLADIKDMGADADIALRRLPGQYAQAVQFVEDVCHEKNINPADIAFTGHSLGGYLGAAVGDHFNSKNIWTFNAPAPDANIWDRIGSNKSAAAPTRPGRGWIQVRSTQDLISKWGDYTGAVTVGINTVGDPHGLDNLRQAVNQTLNGEPVTAVGTAKKGKLSRIFNAVAGLSKALATSAAVGVVINGLMADGQKRKSPAKPTVPV